MREITEAQNFFSPCFCASVHRSVWDWSSGLQITAVILLVALLVPTAAVAQQAETVDASKLGVSLERIRRELRQAEARDDRAGTALKVEYTVEVFGTAPKIKFFENFPLTGPSLYGAPTHRDVIDFLTPQAYKSPPLPISAIAYWAAQKVYQRSKKQRCEDELAEYKRLVMSGVPTAAPRCTQ
ncbi:MAG TPA: hypothetical protein VNJ02_00775 [Vicinamibacterales bacterium]|nr:hypothetical protein [Vicinamibacterales bacterium]